jgi:vancomycin permeability regulator SanA
MSVVVVLGNRLVSESVHPTLRGRLDTGIELFRDVDAEYLLFSGAQTNEEVPAAECEVMRDYAVREGVPEEQILLDRDARDTVGNGYFSRRLVDGLDESVETVYVVSSCYHMDRATFVFEQCFEPDYEVVGDRCYDDPAAPDPEDEEASFDQARRFFDPISPGDVEAIRRRFDEAHVYYEWLND